MRRSMLCLVVLVAAGCGGSADNRPPAPAAGDSGALSADGIGVDLPDGWTGRIVIGASGRPVLHASTLPVEADDTDEGEIATEVLGVNGMYLNVRDLGPGSAAGSLPVQLHPADFDPTPPGRGRLAQASRDVEATASSSGSPPSRAETALPRRSTSIS